MGIGSQSVRSALRRAEAADGGSRTGQGEPAGATGAPRAGSGRSPGQHLAGAVVQLEGESRGGARSRPWRRPVSAGAHRRTTDAPNTASPRVDFMPHQLLRLRRCRGRLWRRCSRGRRGRGAASRCASQHEACAPQHIMHPAVPRSYHFVAPPRLGRSGARREPRPGSGGSPGPGWQAARPWVRCNVRVGVFRGRRDVRELRESVR